MLEIYGHFRPKNQRSKPLVPAANDQGARPDQNLLGYAWPKADMELFNNRLKVLGSLRTMEFNCWEYSPDQLLEFSLLMFQDTGLVEHFRINQTTLRNFLVSIQRVGFLVIGQNFSCCSPSAAIF